ncbi:S-layer homology domain-containing protein, partial [Paenibacillus rigui]
MKKKLLSITASILLFVQGAPVLADSVVFDDIESSYAKDAIKELQGLGMVNGVSDTAFAPTSMISRQDFAILIAKALQLDVTKPPSTATFKDIPVSHYAFPYVEALVRAKVFQGREQNIFGVGEMLTREQLAVVLVRGKQLLSTSRDTNLPFEDRNEISDWAKADVQTVHEAGLMVGDGTYFAPKRAVERQELALVVSRLLHLADHNAIASGVIESITDQSVTINQHTYAKGETVKGLLGQSNAPILIGAVISFETEGASVTKITSLELHKDGQAVEGDEKEFSRNLVLDGQGYMMDGNMDVKADYITVQNLQVSGNFRIGDELKNDFYGKNLQVKGTTIVDGGSSHTVVFDNSALEKVEINKTEVRVEPSGSTSVNEIVVNSNAVVTADAGVTIPKLTVNDGAARVEIDANVASLNLQSSQDSVVSGTGNMGTVTVSGSAGVTFQTTGTITKVEITNKDAKVTLPAGVKIQSLVLPDGVAAADLIANYSAVSGQISSVTSASGQALAGSRSSSKSSSSKQARGTVTGNVYYGTANKPLANASVTLQGLNAATAADGSFVFADVLSGAGQSLSVTADGFAPNPYTAVIDIVSGQTTAVPAIVLTSSTNHAPVVIQAIPKQTIALNGSGVIFNLSERIQDEDGDALKFTVVSLSPKVAKVELNGSELKVTPVAAGTAIINITANDGRGKTASSLFNVTVTAAAVNHDPKLAASGIPDQSAYANGAEVSLDLTQSFSDEDGDALTFQAASSNEGSVAANVYGNWLRLKPLQAGVSTVTVKAEDGKGGKTDASFIMNVTAPPAVNHDPKAAKTIPDQTG